MSEEIIDIIEGEFTFTVYRSANYMVTRFQAEEGPITVTGPSFEYEKNQKYILSGHYVDHPKYGFQFAMLTIEKYLPSQKDEIISFLKGKTFKGIGKKAAEKIYDTFGDDTLKILKEDPDKVMELDLTEKQLVSLEEGFRNLADPENEALFYLVSNGFNNIEAQRIFNCFKLATIEVGQDNPFRFYNEIYGMNFTKVRNFASKVDFTDQQNKYREAYLIYLINEYTFHSGDMYVEKQQLEQLLEKYGGMDNLPEILERCYDKHYLYDDNGRIYLYNDYYDERYIADYIKSFSGGLSIDDELIEEGIEANEKASGIVYHEKQKEAIRAFFRNGISIIVGGPGTGKTTIVKAMVDIYKQTNPFVNIIVAAPTGRAAKRINEICEVEAKTIHSLLKWNKENNTFIYDLENPLTYDVVIIDEFSMVDNSLFASLLKAGSRLKKICIIGDKDQLPSIRPGNVLNDLIDSGLIPVTSLAYNYRQAQGSQIISLANDIRIGDVDLDRYHDDIHFYDIYHDRIDLIGLIRQDLEEGNTLDDVQILAPMYKGEWGIDTLNLALQEAFNPRSFKKHEKKAQKFVFREDDKIIQLKNRPGDDVYNGDIGKLTEIDDKEKTLMVNYTGTYVFYPYEELDDISLAYALSVHKAQGSEYRVVYFIFNRSNIHMLNRNLIYTAISRAKTKLVLIGTRQLLEEGLVKMMKRRKTGLLEVLTNEQ